MRVQRVKKRAITLLEIMIVIFLIGIISAVVGVNMKGSLEKGKVFKTRQAQRQIEEILEFEMAQNNEATPEAIKNRPIDFLKRSGLVKNPAELMEDGWGDPFEIKILRNGDVKAISKNLQKTESKKKAYEAKEEEESLFSF